MQHLSTTPSIANGAVTGDKLDHTSWTTLSINGGDSGFTVYISGSTEPIIKRSGAVVTLIGAVKPNHASNSIGSTICTVPSGFNPPQRILVLSQASGSASWNCSINTNHTVTLERYNGTMSTGSWLPFSFTWIVA